MIADAEIQRIARLTPLSDVLASFDLSIGHVAPREEALAKAVGLTLAADVAVAAGEGVQPPDAAGMKFLAGARLRRIDVALMIALGVERVIVREPRLRVVYAGQSAIMAGAAALIAGAIGAESGVAVTDGMSLEAALNDDSVDAVVAIGGTDDSSHDTSVRALARIGRVAFHGIGIMPGETTALGFTDARPVLLLPGRIDAALAGWLTIGRRLLARLAFRLIEEQPFSAELARDISSPLGLAEVIPVRRRLGRVEPLASGHLPIQTLARAEGWVLVPADSEGYPAGARIVVRPWP
jgi:molybdopterin molybdotransferase